MRKIGGAFLLVFAAVVGGIGALWFLGGIGGAEWDYCGGDGDCTSAETMALFLIVPAAVAGYLGFWLLRRERNGPRSGESLT